MSKQMFTPAEHAARLPGWKKWAQEHGVVVPPAFLYNYVPTSAIDHVGDAVAAERERCAGTAETLGVTPELNVNDGGPEWYKHGQSIAAKIRESK